jgi:hypothetical protein
VEHGLPRPRHACPRARSPAARGRHPATVLVAPRLGANQPDGRLPLAQQHEGRRRALPAVPRRASA